MPEPPNEQGPPAQIPQAWGLVRGAELEELARGLVEHGRDIFTVIDGDGWIVLASPNLARTLGYSPERRRGGSIFDLLHPEDAESARRDFRAAIRARAPFDLVFRLRHADGAWRWLEASGQPFAGRGGELRYLIVSRDVTARHRDDLLRRGEVELLRRLVSGFPASEALAALIEHAERAAPDLVACVLLLEEEGRRLRPFVAGGIPAQHLHGVDGIAIGPGASPCALAARRAERLWVEDLERDPRSAGVFRERARALGLRACGAAPVVLRSGESAGAFAVYRFRPGGPDGFEERLLATGAELASLVMARARVEREPGGRFPEEYARHFQEVLRQSRAVLDALPEDHAARSSMQQVLRAARDALGMRERLAEIEPVEPAAPPARAGRVLLADDDEWARSLAFWVLRRAGYEVVTACDGQEAVERFRAEDGRFDLVVLDRVMPRLGGEAASERLRALRADLPVLFASALEGGDAHRAPRSENTAFLEKPYDPDALVEQVRTLLAR